MNTWLKMGGLLLVAVGAVACVDGDDVSSNVKDLRVLGVAVEVPELMAPTCDLNGQSLEVLTQEVTYRALLADPKGEGRSIAYTLWACANPDDERCEDESSRIQLAQGTTTAGDMEVRIRPGASQVRDGTLLLEKVRQADPYKGYGGIRMPLVLHVTAGAESVHAQKLMVFSCPVVPGMVANVQPVLRGLTLDDQAWDAAAPLTLQGKGPFVVRANDISDLEESYVVPGLRSESVNLKEAWTISWHATLGEFSPEQTGGADFAGEPGRHRTEWEPPEKDAVAQEVTFWAVVRDGRGGSSWLVRKVRWSP
ncbi:hypothetical protein MYSTI_00835 [Myxococcus stipitatus DSM 14675]|uniref:Lipoprotein n=1 Tax=Myxococcus stipitatus (strain DSM 14675 / JCM 12634 / Mx s8) TaxID=1278073 RepID=L7U6S8_MYXSD|nr:hypothetical protein [Myxococcus stipitatus]AGC42184.1 hypothetical protein MYSTI_00835 [Myxococcus stipitatus DSM 14675]